MAKAAKTLSFAMLICAFMMLASNKASAMTVYFNDGKIEYVDYQPGAIHIKLTRAGLDYGTIFNQAQDLARRVQARRPSAFRNWPAININKLAIRIQAHAGWYFVSPIMKSHANPVDVTWQEIT